MSQPHPSSCIICDTTLRDGEQAAGVAFSLTQRRDIMLALAAAGVSEMEIGTPAMGPEEVTAIATLMDIALPTKRYAWCRSTVSDIEAAYAAGVDGIWLSVPASQRHWTALSTPFIEWCTRIGQLVPLAKEYFSFVGVGLQDASRADLMDVIQLGQIAADAGADRLRLADSAGCWHPAAVSERVQHVRREVANIPLAIHCHDDFGMATANTLAAISAGVVSVDVTVAGLGERAGNAALEQVAVGSERCLGVSTGIDHQHVAALAQLVMTAAKRDIDVAAPLIGRQAFRHESGIHVAMQQQDALAYQAIRPESIGRLAEPPVIGRHSGLAALRQALALPSAIDETPGPSQAEQLSDYHLRPLLQRVRRAAAKLGRSITQAELLRLWDHTQGAASVPAFQLASG